MALTEADKKKIEDEERYRQEVKQKLIKTGKNPTLAAVLSFIIPGLGQIYCGKIARGIVILFTAWLVFPWIYGIFDAYSLAQGKDTSIVRILIFILILGILAAAILIAINPTERQKNSNKTAGSSKPESITEEYKNSLAKTFCDERNKPNVRAVNFADFINMYEKAGESVTLNPSNGRYQSAENCKKIVDICLELWNKEDCENIANKKIWIGMTKDELILSWGLPNDRNNTTGSWGIHSQWVYGDSGPYAYLEGKTNTDLKVTSWQD